MIPLSTAAKKVTAKTAFASALHPALPRQEELPLHFGCYVGMENACEKAHFSLCYNIQTFCWTLLLSQNHRLSEVGKSLCNQIQPMTKLQFVNQTMTLSAMFRLFLNTFRILTPPPLWAVHSNVWSPLLGRNSSHCPTWSSPSTPQDHFLSSCHLLPGRRVQPPPGCNLLSDSYRDWL